MSRIKLAFVKHHCQEYTYNTQNEKFKSTFGFTCEEYFKLVDKIYVKNLFPEAAKFVINQWTGTSSYFYVYLKDSDGNKICSMTVDRGYSQDNWKVRDISAKSNEIQQAFTEYNSNLWKKMCKNAGISLVNKANNSVEVRSYRDYKPTDNITNYTGTIYNIIDRFVTANDRLRYINGSYYEFENKEIDKLYHFFLNNYNGNYFLDNAVKRGCIID